MKLKADWHEYLSGIRNKELEILFFHLPQEKILYKTLELGAGNGFQSEILARRVKRLIATDINPHRLRKTSSGNIEYRICDAELVDTYFEEKSFDIVFSSNLLEHLPDPERALQGIYRVLKDDGIAAHIVPSPFYKLAQMLLFYPNFVASRIKTLRSVESGYSYLKEKLKIYVLGTPKPESCATTTCFDNNPKVSNRRKRLPLMKLLWPLPHGVSRDHLEEFKAWKLSRWMMLFESAGFQVKHVVKGPVFSGYGFGFDRCRHALERMGLASEYILISTKK